MGEDLGEEPMHMENAHGECTWRVQVESARYDFASHFGNVLLHVSGDAEDPRTDVHLAPQQWPSGHVGA